MTLGGNPPMLGIQLEDLEGLDQPYEVVIRRYENSENIEPRFEVGFRNEIYPVGVTLDVTAVYLNGREVPPQQLEGSNTDLSVERIVLHPDHNAPAVHVHFVRGEVPYPVRFEDYQ